MITSPTVSVIIPAYNTASLIAAALDSVLAQTFRSFEAIVVNDGSPDTADLERALAPYLGRIVYIVQNNRRAAGARNTGIRHARGEYLAFLDSDQVWFPRLLESQMRLFEQDPSPDLVYANEVAIRPGSRRIETFMEFCPSRGPCTFESLVREDCHIPVSTVVARKRAIVEAGLFDEGLRCCDDYEMWLRVAHGGGRIAYQLEPLCSASYGRPGSLGTNELNTSKAAVQILAKFEDMELSPAARAAVEERAARERALLDLVQAKLQLQSNQLTEAAESLRKANTYFRNPKYRMALVGLRAAPSLARQGVRLWIWLSTASRRVRDSAHSARDASCRPEVSRESATYGSR